MKALPFIDMYDLSYDKLQDYYHGFGMKNHNLGEIRLKLKGQFHIEELPEMFKDIAIENKSEYIIQFRHSESVFYYTKQSDRSDFQFEIFLGKQHYKKIYTIYKPIRTIDDFLHLTKPHINLEWNI